MSRHKRGIPREYSSKGMEVMALARRRQSSIFILHPKTIPGFRLTVVSLKMASLIILWLPDFSRDTWDRYRLFQPLARGFVRAARVGTSPYHTSIGWQRDRPQGHIGWDLRRAGIYRHQRGEQNLYSCCCRGIIFPVYFHRVNLI